MEISEIQFVPVKPQGGLVAFASFVLNNCLYLGSIGIVTRPSGGYRLLYPSKKVLNQNFSIFHPITQQFGIDIERRILLEYEKVMKMNDRHGCFNNTRT